MDKLTSYKKGNFLLFSQITGYIMNLSQHRIVAFEADHLVFAEGCPLEMVYQLLEGRVGLWKRQKRLMDLSAVSILGIEGYFTRTERYLYSLKTETDCRFALYSPDKVQEALFSRPQFEEMVLENLSKQLTWLWKFLGDMQSREESLYYVGDIRTYAPGEFILQEGDTSTEIYRIVSTDLGLEVSKQGTKLAVLNEPGQFFGEMAALLKERRSASVKALGQTVLEVYPGEFLSHMIEDYPEFAQQLVHGLGQRLEKANRLLLNKGNDPMN